MKILVKVKTGALSDSIESVGELNYLAHIRDKPIENKANLKLIRLLSKQFGVHSGNILIKNPKSRKKIIEIVGK